MLEKSVSVTPTVFIHFRLLYNSKVLQLKKKKKQTQFFQKYGGHLPVTEKLLTSSDGSGDNLIRAGKNC